VCFWRWTEKQHNKRMMVAQRPPNDHLELLQPRSNQEIDRMYRKSFLEYAKQSVNLKDKV